MVKGLDHGKGGALDGPGEHSPLDVSNARQLCNEHTRPTLRDSNLTFVELGREPSSFDLQIPSRLVGIFQATIVPFWYYLLNSYNVG